MTNTPKLYKLAIIILILEGVIMRNYSAYPKETLQSGMESHPCFMEDWSEFLEIKPYNPIDVFVIYSCVEDTLAVMDKPCLGIRPNSDLEKNLGMNETDKRVLHGRFPEPPTDRSGFMAVQTMEELVDFLL